MVSQMFNALIVLSQYPLIWAVASDLDSQSYAKLRSCVSIPSHLGSSFGHWTIRVHSGDPGSQYPLIWAVASDKMLEDMVEYVESLNTLSFGQ